MTRVVLWLTNLVRRHRFEDDLAEELAFHLEARVAQWQREGLSTAEARRRARLEFGSVEKVKEEVREVRFGAWAEELVQDVRYSLRVLGKYPGFTVAAVLTLAVGIGANTAVFSAVHGVVFRHLPGTATDRVVTVWSVDDHLDIPHDFNYPDLLDFRDRTTSFESLAGRRLVPLSVAGSERTEHVWGELVTTNFFDVLGLRPMLGRVFDASDADDAPVVVISHGLWMRQFGGSVDIAGREVRLNGERFTVVGVTPTGFTGSRFPIQSDFWLPIGFHDLARPGVTLDWRNWRGNHWLELIGRLSDGVTLASARAEVDTVVAALAEEYPESNRGVGAVVQFERDARLDRARPEVAMLGGLTLMAIVGLVLAVACANVANLLLARASSRRREFAVRLAVGAGRGRLVRQLLTESVLLSLLGGVVGLAVTYGLLEVLAFYAPVSTPPFVFDFSPDSRVFAFATIVTFSTGVLFGTVPALAASRSPVAPTLKGEPAAVTARLFRRLRASQLLVVSEVALTLLLLICAGLFVRSFRSSLELDPGFEVDNHLLAELNVGVLGYPESRGRQIFDDVVERLGELPGVRSVTTALHVPLSGNNVSRVVFVDGRELTESGRGLGVSSNYVDVDYASTIGLSLLRGREFTRQDDQDAPPVAVINDAAAQRFWPGAEAVGRYLRLGSPDATQVQVVGVVQTGQFVSLGEAPRPFIYFPRRQRYSPQLTVHLRTEGDPLAQAAALRDVVREVDPDLPIITLRTMDAHRGLSMASARIGASLTSGFAVVAVFLAAVGLYGVLAHAVNRRKREIGIRIALGARRATVMTMVFAQGLGLAAVGTALGLLGAFGVSRFLATALYGVPPVDPVTFLVVPILLLGIAAAACYLPARRATRVDPMDALRHE